MNYSKSLFDIFKTSNFYVLRLKKYCVETRDCYPTVVLPMSGVKYIGQVASCGHSGTLEMFLSNVTCAIGRQMKVCEVYAMFV